MVILKNLGFRKKNCYFQKIYVLFWNVYFLGDPILSCCYCKALELLSLIAMILFSGKLTSIDYLKLYLD